MPSDRVLCDLYASAIQKAVEEKLPVEIVYGRLVWKRSLANAVEFFHSGPPIKEAQKKLEADGGHGEIDHKVFWAVLGAMHDAKTEGETER